jgi:hypothetical protein
MHQGGAEIAEVLQRVAAAAEAAGVFGPVSVQDGALVCRAAGSAAPASYRLELIDGRLWVSLVMADRWQSESIESDLMHSGDKLEELLDEELADLGYEHGPGAGSGPGSSTGSGNAGRPSVEHFRSDDKLFTFRSPVPVAWAISGGGQSAAAASETARLWLLAYEACFRQLGDMDGADEDED